MTNLPLWLIPLFPLIGTVVLAAISLASTGSKKGASEGIVGGLAVIFKYVLCVIRFACFCFNGCNWLEHAYSRRSRNSWNLD